MKIDLLMNVTSCRVYIDGELKSIELAPVTRTGEINWLVRALEQLETEVLGGEPQVVLTKINGRQVDITERLPRFYIASAAHRFHDAERMFNL